MANNDICVCVLGESLCEFVSKKLPFAAHFEHKYFLYPWRIFLCMHQSCLISRVGVPSLADCDQNHLCNQSFRISRTAPVKKSEIFYLSFWVWISLFVSRDFPLAVCPTHRVAQLSSHTGQLALNAIFYICVHASVCVYACVCVHLCKQWRVKAATSKA